MRLALAVGSAMLGLGLPFVFVFGHDHVSDGWADVATLIVVTLAMLGMVAAENNSPNDLRSVVFVVAAGLSLMGCLWLSNEALAELTLTERGRTDSCLVEDQEKNVEITLVQPYYSLSESTKYAYRLKCPAGGPDRMMTTHSFAEKGAIASVRWDPSGRIAPRPAYEVTAENSFEFEVIAGCASAYFALLDVLIDVRRNPDTEVVTEPSDYLGRAFSTARWLV